MTSHKIFINRTFPCPANLLFEWLIQPALFIQWFGPPKLEKIEVTIDPKKEGRFKVLLKRNDGTLLIIDGQYLEINPPILLEFNMSYQGIEQPKSKVRIEISPISDSASQLRLIQEFDQLPKAMEGRTHAWRSMFNLLEIKLSS